MADEKTKKAHALRDFHDAGTQQTFKKGDTIDLPEGVYANYAAAGLVSDKAPEAPSKASAKAD